MQQVTDYGIAILGGLAIIAHLIGNTLKGWLPANVGAFFAFLVTPLGLGLLLAGIAALIAVKYFRNMLWATYAFIGVYVSFLLVSHFWL